MGDISYKRLRILLIEKDLKLRPICDELGFSSSTAAKLSNDKPVNLATLIAIASYLDVDIGDIVSIKKDRT